MVFIKDLAYWVASFANSPYGTVALFVIAFAESSFFPIPPDVLLIPLALSNVSYAFVYATITTLGSVLGGLFGYLIGDKGGKTILYKLVSKEKILLVKHYYQKFDVWAVGMAAFTPIPYKVFTISAGVFNLNFRRFLLASFLGRGGRFFIVAALIFILGPAVKFFLDKYFDLAVVLFTVLLIGGFLTINFLSKRLTKTK